MNLTAEQYEMADRLETALEAAKPEVDDNDKTAWEYLVPGQWE